MSANVLVIGSNSFSGASFIKFLLEKDYYVFGCSRSHEKESFFLPYKWTNNKNFTFFQYDINKDTNKILELIKSEKIEYIVNFAAQSMVGESWEYPNHWFQTNAVAVSSLVSSLAKLEFIKKYVHITTPEVYGNCAGFISEDFPFNPSTPYASSRVASDLIVKNYHEAFNFPFIATRAANVFGPGQQLYRIIPKSIISILTGKKIPLHGGGVSTRSFIHIDDVSNATEKLMLSKSVGETYHISTNDIISIKDLITKIAEILNTDFNLVVDLIPERVGKDSTYELSSQKIRNDFNWSEKIPLHDGIISTIDWVKNYLPELKKTDFEYIHKK